MDHRCFSLIMWQLIQTHHDRHQVRTHTLTNETYFPKYTEGQYWYIDYDEHGFGLLLNELLAYDESFSCEDDSWKDSIVIEDVMKHAVYQGGKAGLVIFCNHGPCKGDSIRLGQLLTKHAEHNLKFSVGDHIKWNMDVSLYQFRWPRQGL